MNPKENPERGHEREKTLTLLHGTVVELESVAELLSPLGKGVVMAVGGSKGSESGAGVLGLDCPTWGESWTTLPVSNSRSTAAWYPWRAADSLNGEGRGVGVYPIDTRRRSGR
jgi:hypothetical protein